MAFRFSGTRITGPRGDSGTLVFTADAGGFTDMDRLVFTLTRKESGGKIMERAMSIDADGRSVLSLVNEDTRALSPGMYVWSARYVLNAQTDNSGHVTGGEWVDTPWRNCEFEVLEVNAQPW